MLNRMPSVEKNLKQITKDNDGEREIADTENKGRERWSVDLAARRSERARARERERERVRSIAMYSLVLGESPPSTPRPPISRCTGGVSHLRALSLSPPPSPPPRPLPVAALWLTGRFSGPFVKAASRHALESLRDASAIAQFRQFRHFGQFWLRANRLCG